MFTLKAQIIELYTGKYVDKQCSIAGLVLRVLIENVITVIWNIVDIDLSLLT